MDNEEVKILKSLKFIRNVKLYVDKTTDDCEDSEIYSSSLYPDDVFVRYHDDYFPIYYLKTEEEVLNYKDTDLSLLCTFVIKKYLAYLSSNQEDMDIVFK